ncbi:Uncharacterised protein [Candidatus Tiddalikarchaeum anstoanum]|nr:Uncharacterised protein [Candidatus Tiddalikarchaeum anstoanum]
MMSLSDKEIVYEILKGKSKAVNIPLSELEITLHDFASDYRSAFKPEMIADLVIIRYNQNQSYKDITLTPIPKRVTAQIYN